MTNTIIKLLCCGGLALLLSSCGKRDNEKITIAEKPAEEAVDIPMVQERVSQMKAEEEKMDDALRLSKRTYAISRLLAAHQKISMYKIFADKTLAIIEDEESASRLAVLQDELSEIRNDIRDTSKAIPDLELKAQELSQRGDPPYEVELSRYRADISEAVGIVDSAKREGAANAQDLEEALTKMIKASADEVMAGTYVMPKK